MKLKLQPCGKYHTPTDPCPACAALKRPKLRKPLNHRGTK